MKKFVKSLIVLTLAMIMVLCAACGGDSESNATTAPTSKASASAKPSASPTEKATASPAATETAEPTPTPEPSPTPEPLPPFSDDMKGKLFDSAIYNRLDTIFEDDFEDEDWTQGGLVLSQESSPAIEVYDEQLCINSVGGENAESWARYYIPDVFDFETYSQIEVTMDIMTDGGGCSGTSVGVFTSDYIPDGLREGSGFWASPTTKTSFPLNGLSSVPKGGWSSGFFSATAPESFATMKTLAIVVNADMITYYMKTEAGEMAMITKVVMEDAAIVVYDAAGTEIFRGDHDSQKFAWTGTALSIFTHFNYTTVDNLVIRGY